MNKLIDFTNKLFNQSFHNLSLIPHATRWWVHSLLVLVVLAGYICTESTKPAFAQDGGSSAQCPTTYSEECFSFSLQEEWAWEQIVQGKPAEMNRFSKESKSICNPLNAGEPIKQSSRTLSHKFIEFVATHQRYEQGDNTRLVHIECAVVDGQINLSNKKIRPEFTIRASLLKNGIDIANAHFLRGFTIEKSSVTGTVNSAVALFDRGLSLIENRHEQVILDNAQIKANLLVEYSTLTKTFSAQAIDVGGDIDLMRTVFGVLVNLKGAKTAGILFAENSQFKGEFIALNLDAAGGIFLINSTFEKIVYLAGAKTAGILFAENSQFKGEFDAFNLDAADGIFLRNTTFKETVYLTGAKTAGILFAKDSQFKGTFKANNLDVVGDMFLGNVSFKKQVNLLDAKIGKQLEITHAVFKNKFIAKNIEASARVLLTNTTFKKTVDLTGAKTAGALSADGSQFEGEFIAFNLDVTSGILLTNTTFKETVDLLDAKIGKHLEIKDSVFKKKFNASNLDAAGGILLTNTAFKETVNLINAKTEGQLNIKQSEFKKDLTAYGMQAGDNISLTETHFEGQVDLSIAKLGGKLKLVGSSFANELDLRQTHIASDFILYDAKAANEGDVEKSAPLWKKEAQLMLNRAHAGVLHARMPNSWLMYEAKNRPTSTLLNRDLRGFTYDSLHLPEGDEIDDERITQLIEWAGGATMATTETDHSEKKETPWDSFIKQLGHMIGYLDLGGKQCVALEWQTGKTKYTPQPYTELAEKLREMGAADQSDRVLIARFNHHHAKQYDETKLWPVMGKISCYVSRYTVDPFRPLYLFLFLIFLGALVNFFAYKSSYKFFVYKSVSRDYLLRKLGTPVNFFAYKSSYKKLRRGLVRPLYDVFYFLVFHFLVGLFYYVFRPLFHSFRNSIPIPGFLGYTKETGPDGLIYLLYAQKIIGLILLASALGHLAI